MYYIYSTVGSLFPCYLSGNICYKCKHVLELLTQTSVEQHAVNNLLPCSAVNYRTIEYLSLLLRSTL